MVLVHILSLDTREVDPIHPLQSVELGHGVQEPIGHKHLAIGHHIELIVAAHETCPEYPAPSKLIPDTKDGVRATELLPRLER
jgi:hypothetical protein